MKKIMTVVLALAVIFGFAACSDGSTVSFYGEEALSITVASAPEYIVGQTLNPDDVTLRVVYNQGSDKTFKASELGIKPATAKTFKLEANNTFTVVYGRDDASTPDVKENEWPITIKAAELTNLVIDTTNAAKDYNGKVLDVSNLVYTAELANGKKVPVTAAIAHEIADFKFVVSKVKDGKVTVSLEKASEETSTPAEKVKFATEWTLTAAERKIKSVEITQDTSKDVFEWNGETRNKISAVTYLMTVSYENGDVDKPVAATTAEVVDTDVTHDLDDTYTVAVKVTIDGKEYTDNSVTIAPTKDRITGFKVQHKMEFGDDNKSQYVFKPGETIWAYTFSIVDPVWASGHEYKEGDGDNYNFKFDTNDLVIEPSMVPEGWGDNPYPNNDTPLKFTLKSYPAAVADTDSVKNVSVKTN